MPRRAHVIGLILVAALVVLLNLPVPAGQRIKGGARDNIAPFQNGLSLLVSRLRGAAAALGAAVTGTDERRSMLEELARLRSQVWRLKTHERDNRELRKLLGFRERQAHRLLLCEVVARGDTTGWWQKIRLNRGSEHGVGIDCAVITAEGLVGRTIEVSRFTCDVLLITDPNCRVACKLADTGAFGIVTGEGTSVAGEARLEMLYAVRPCTMKYMPIDGEVLENMEVVTSGLGGVYPEGLLLGRVARVYRDPDKLYRRADIAPAADMNALRYVFVVMEEK